MAVVGQSHLLTRQGEKSHLLAGLKPVVVVAAVEVVLTLAKLEVNVGVTLGAAEVVVFPILISIERETVGIAAVTALMATSAIEVTLFSMAVNADCNTGNAPPFTRAVLVTCTNSTAVLVVVMAASLVVDAIDSCRFRSPRWFVPRLCPVCAVGSRAGASEVVCSFWMSHGISRGQRMFASTNFRLFTGRAMSESIRRDVDAPTIYRNVMGEARFAESRKARRR
jgi:hypothetical protein